MEGEAQLNLAVEREYMREESRCVEESLLFSAFGVVDVIPRMFGKKLSRLLLLSWLENAKVVVDIVVVVIRRRGRRPRAEHKSN